MIKKLTMLLVGAVIASTSWAQYDEEIEQSDGTKIVKKDGLYGFVTKFGEETIAPEYLSVSYEPETKLVVSETENGYFVSDDDGFRWIEDCLQSISDKSDVYGALKAKVDGKWGLIGPDGHWKTWPKYTSLGYYKNGFMMVYIKGKGLGFLDRKGELAIPTVYEKAEEFSADFMTPVYFREKWLFIDTNATTQSFCGNKYFEKCTVFENGFAEVIKKDGEGLKIDKDGNCHTSSYMWNNYDDIGPVNMGLKRVIRGDKFGFIDINGNIIIPLEYDGAYHWSNADMVGVNKGGQFGYINRQNEPVIPFEYIWIDQVKEGFILAQIFGKGYVFLRTDGTLLTDQLFERARGFKNGKARVNVDKTWYDLFPDGSLKVQEKQ